MIHEGMSEGAAGGPQRARPPVRRVGAAAVRIMIGLVCLLGPLLTAVAAFLASPAFVEEIPARYIGFNYAYSEQTPESLKCDSYPEMAWFAVKLYAERVAIETIGRTYDSLGRAAWWACLAALLAVVVHASANRVRGPPGRRLLIEAAAFAALVTPLTLLSGAPFAPVVIATATAVFVLNFPLPVVLDASRPGSRARRAAGAIVCVGAVPGLSHVLAPAGLLALAAWSFLPKNQWAKRMAVHLGRVATCLVTLPAVILTAFAFQTVPLSPQARIVIQEIDLYDIEIDRPANHLLVTRKWGGTGIVLSLDQLQGLATFRVPSGELEDIELDPERREIYHVDRDTQTLLVLDADTFQVRLAARILLPSGGSTKIALDKSSGHLVISFENDNLFLVDRATWKCWQLAGLGNVNPTADPRNGLVYINSEMRGWVASMDLKADRVVRREEAPPRGERMALSEKRQELYAPDAEAGRIWVYSTPDLRILRKIPAQFGVRAIAVDDDNGLLLAASVVTGYVDVIDLRTDQRIARHYVGKYGRIIRVDAATRRAFITLARDGLCVLNY
jgi:DNA-binding beta-propeller fold protein YncE